MSRAFQDEFKKRHALFYDSPAFFFRENGHAGLRKVTTKEFYHAVAILGGEMINRGYKKRILLYTGKTRMLGCLPILR